MKILRAIGHFFAKIGRWIANTAWVQPLLIVGGIFAIIFSIPYIKKGFENLFADNTNQKYQWYKNRALSLEEGGQADRLLEYLEFYNDENEQKIRSEFGSKFLVVFAKESCSGCEEGIEGYDTAYNSGYVAGFRLYSIIVDQMDSTGKEYLAKPIYAKHNDLFTTLGEYYGECDDEDYPLYRNLNTLEKHSQVESLKTKASTLDVASTSDEGLDTPLLLMVDLDMAGEEYYGTNGISHVFYNYVDFDYSDTKNAATKAMVVRDLWNYQGIFATDFEK